MNKKLSASLVDWPLVSLGLIILLLVNVNEFARWTQAFDFSIYDKQLETLSIKASDKILIVEIDEQSLSLLGSWPWPRSYHGEMINLLTQADAGVIAYNVVFSNADPLDESDQILAKAIEKSGRTILPLYFDQLFKKGDVLEVLPDKAFSQNSGLGHVNSYLDDDGTLRSVRLMDRYSDHQWPHFSFASFLFNQPYSSLLEKNLGTVFIPFVSEGDFQRVSFVDVLTGLVPAKTFSQRAVFVGMTATTMGDPLLTPVGEHGRQTPAVEINANVYQALDHNNLIAPLSSLIALAINTLFILIMLYLLPRLSVFQQLLMILVSLVAVWFISHGLLQQGHWYRASGLLVALLAIPFLWNLIRLSRLFQYFRLQINQLKHQQAQESFHLPSQGQVSDEQGLIFLLKLMQIERYQLLSTIAEDVAMNISSQASLEIDSITKHLIIKLNRDTKVLVLYFDQFTGLERRKLNLLHQLLTIEKQGGNQAVESSAPLSDVFSKQLSLMEGFQQQLAMSHSLFEASIEGIAAGIFVSDLNGKVLFSNRALEELTQEKIIDTRSLFQSITLMQGDWQSLLRDVILLQKTIRVEARSQGRDLSVSFSCIESESGLAPLLVFNIIDISAVKQAHKSRNEMIDFLSHDLRSPMASLQALVNQARSNSEPMNIDKLIEKVDHYSQRGLNFAEQFLELAKVESDEEVTFYEVDLYSVAQNAFDTLYHQAQEKSIKLEIETADECWVMANGEMLERVILNLVSNAIKYSPTKSRVLLSISLPNPSMLEVRISDQGPGIPAELVDKLFKPYARGSDSNTQKEKGIGLGLRFVDVALKRLGSHIQFESSRDGTSFYFTLETVDL